MASSKFIIPLSLSSSGVALTGYTGHVYIVPVGSVVNNTMPLTEDSITPGTYYRDSVEHGQYNLYVDTDKSGSPVSADLKLQNIDHGVIDDAVNGDKIVDASVGLNHLTQAAKDYIGSGGTVTNNPDDVYLKTNASSEITWHDDYAEKFDGDASASSGLGKAGLWNHIKNNNIVNVKDFGAIGDGVTDDKTAIDNADASGINLIIYLGNVSYKYGGTFSPSNEFCTGTIIANNGTFIFGALGANRFKTKGNNSEASGIVGEYNIINSDTVSSFIAGGNDTQPNLLGKEYHYETFDGDGSTTVFNATVSFTVNDLTRYNVKVNIIRKSDGALWSKTEGTDFTVSGYGTSSITITMTTAPASDEILELVIYGENDDSSAEPTLATIFGYDNLVNPIMSTSIAAHSMIMNGNGHNTILGGSYHRVDGYHNVVLGGKWNRIGINNGTVFGSAAGGQGNEIDGSQSFAYGARNNIDGDLSVAFGSNHEIPYDKAIAFGYFGKPLAAGELVQGRGQSGDTQAGLRQYRRFLGAQETTDATTGYLSTVSGATSFVIPENSAAYLKVSVVAIRDDYTQFQAWSGEFLVHRVGSGTPNVNGSTGDVSLTSVYSVGSPSWTVAARGLGSNLTIRVTGAVSSNIRWVGTLELTQIIY